MGQVKQTTSMNCWLRESFLSLVDFLLSEVYVVITKKNDNKPTCYSTLNVMSSLIQQFTILGGIRGKKKVTVYIGISWNVKGLDRTHTLPPTSTQTCSNMDAGLETRWPQITQLKLHFSTTTEGFSKAGNLRNESEAHELSHFCKLNSEHFVYAGLWASVRCVYCAVANNVGLGTASDTTRRKDNFHLQALNTHLLQAIRCFVI